MLISYQKEMISCDVDADKNIYKAFGTRRANLYLYYKEMKRLKNDTITSNINEFYQVQKLFLFSDDLGIDGAVFRNSYNCTDLCSRQKLGILPSIVHFYKKAMQLLRRKLSICKVTASENEYYFVGNENRVMQYLSLEKIKFSKVSYHEYFALGLIYYLSSVVA